MSEVGTPTAGVEKLFDNVEPVTTRLSGRENAYHDAACRAPKKMSPSLRGARDNYFGDVFLPMIPMPFLHFLFLRQTLP